MTKTKKQTKRRKGQSASKARLCLELRDYFAAKAIPVAELVCDGEDFDCLASSAYRIAEALMKARAKA